MSYDCFWSSEGDRRGNWQSGEQLGSTGKEKEERKKVYSTSTPLLPPLALALALLRLSPSLSTFPHLLSSSPPPATTSPPPRLSLPLPAPPASPCLLFLDLDLHLDLPSHLNFSFISFFLFPQKNPNNNIKKKKLSVGRRRLLDLPRRPPPRRRPGTRLRLPSLHARGLPGQVAAPVGGNQEGGALRVLRQPAPRLEDGLDAADRRRGPGRDERQLRREDLLVRSEARERR
mgnify:CR=1 FL=1